MPNVGSKVLQAQVSSLTSEVKELTRLEEQIHAVVVKKSALMANKAVPAETQVGTALPLRAARRAFSPAAATPSAGAKRPAPADAQRRRRPAPPFPRRPQRDRPPPGGGRRRGGGRRGRRGRGRRGARPLSESLS